jgi:hypothetical protein
MCKTCILVLRFVAKGMEKSSIAIAKIARVTIFDGLMKIIASYSVSKISTEIQQKSLRLLRLPRLPNIAKTIASPKMVGVWTGIFIVTK